MAHHTFNFDEILDNESFRTLHTDSERQQLKDWIQEQKAGDMDEVIHNAQDIMDTLLAGQLDDSLDNFPEKEEEAEHVTDYKNSQLFFLQLLIIEQIDFYSLDLDTDEGLEEAFECTEDILMTHPRRKAADTQ